MSACTWTMRVCPSFFSNDAPSTEFYTLSSRRSSDLVDRLRVRARSGRERAAVGLVEGERDRTLRGSVPAGRVDRPIAESSGDRKSTRLNSSHVEISYAVFCLKKKRRLRLGSLVRNQQ